MGMQRGPYSTQFSPFIESCREAEKETEDGCSHSQKHLSSSLPSSHTLTPMALEELLVSNVDKKRKKGDDNSGTDDELDVGENVHKVASSYGCRFCPMRFAKSQALGGHMNRHRQEREKEQYHQARELVSHMQQQPRWNMLLTNRNAAIARMGQLASGLPRADDSTAQAGQLISSRLASYNVTPTAPPPPSHCINADMEAQAQLIPMQLLTSSQSILAGGSINHFHPAVSASTNLATNGTASTWLDYLAQSTSTATAAAVRLQPAPALSVVTDGTLAAALQVAKAASSGTSF